MPTTETAPRAAEDLRTLEQVVGHWIAAGVDDTEEVAAGLGLAPRHLARPVRTLVRAGAVEQEDGALRLTPAGEAWLAPSVGQPDPAAPPLALPAAPRLDPLELPTDDVLPVAPLSPAPVGTRWLTGWPRLALSIPVAMPRVRLPRRRSVVAAAAAGLLVLSVCGGWLVASLGRHGAAHAATPTAVPTRLLEPPVELTAPPEPTVTPRHLRVAGTNGLGVVLRPTPGSAERLEVLTEGSRVQAAGDPVHQGGRDWLNVTAPDGRTGWAAADFLKVE